MGNIEFSSEQLVNGLLSLPAHEMVCILDSCGTENLGSRYLIAGISPVEIITLNSNDPESTLKEFDRVTTNRDFASIFSISYDFGLKLLGIGPGIASGNEPDIFIAVFENLVFHDYRSGTTKIDGNSRRISEFVSKLRNAAANSDPKPPQFHSSPAASNFSRESYISSIETIKSHIRNGNTYQTNLTQQFSVSLDPGLTPQEVFRSLRRDHPAAFASFLSRTEDHVVSISPERFILAYPADFTSRKITSSPIKGTGGRGIDSESDAALRAKLLASAKDRAENTMIVDLIRNDLGRVCEFGSVDVEQLCALEEHPTLFHLVSTVSGILRSGTKPSEIIRAVFPCGSITGCPKIRTMEIIAEIETEPRGLSMGAIGYSGFDNNLDMNVAIRTMVVKNGMAVFNTGGGIVFDSDPETEWKESVLKAKALLNALGSSF